MKKNYTKILAAVTAAAVLQIPMIPGQAGATTAVYDVLPAGGAAVWLDEGTSVYELCGVAPGGSVDLFAVGNCDYAGAGALEDPDLQVVTGALEVTDESELEDPEHFANLVIADCASYVNVRDIPSADGEIVGKLYADSVGTYLEETDGWYKISSGNCIGYVSTEYCITGDAAVERAREIGTRFAVVDTETLNVRVSPGTDATIMTMLPRGEDLLVLEEGAGEDGDWILVSCSEGEGYVHADYVKLHTEFVTAESAEEEEARLAAEAEERRLAYAAAQQTGHTAETSQQVPQATQQVSPTEETTAQQPGTPAAESLAEGQVQEAETVAETDASSRDTVPAVAASGDPLGSQVASYACQFVGNPYVYGGSSLTNGTDCSGFVMSVYKNFGISLPHSSRSDRSVGSAVEGGIANAQPGDIVCYSGHVGIYIGGGQIVHAANARSGIIISNADYMGILAVRRIF